MPNYTIRKANTADIDALEPIIRSWESESKLDEYHIGHDMECFKTTLRKMCENNSAALFLLIHGRSPVGWFGVTIFLNPIDGSKIANEHLWYVIPAHRGISSLKMIFEAKKWAVVNGCKHFMCNASTLASDLHDGVCDIYESIGMKKFETTYIEYLGG